MPGMASTCKQITKLFLSLTFFPDMRETRLLLAAVFLLMISLAAGLPFPANRRCEEVGVFCFDVNDKDVHTDGISEIDESKIKFSLTITRDPVKDMEHHWLFWLSDSLSTRVTVAFSPNETSQSHPIHAHSISINKSPGHTVTYDIMKSGVIINDNSKILFGAPKTDDNSLMADTKIHLAKILMFEDKPITVIVLFGFEIDKPDALIATDHPVLLFKGPRPRQISFSTADPHDSDASAPTANTSLTGTSKWIWMAIGIVAVVALILLIILMLYGIKYVKFKINTTSQESKSSTGSFISTVTRNSVHK